jgi:oligoribonuclease NrnB/cAMP/cGMP phosphodiesterase (DHH superfamily)
MPTTVVYHAGCADGFCAAWLFKHAFPDAEFVPASYGDPPPDVRGRDVFVADFSYRWETMLEVARDAASLTVLDHHKTAEQALRGLPEECRLLGLAEPFIRFDMGKSGGRLTWEYLAEREGKFARKPFRDVPWLVRYTEDRDLWLWKMHASREVNAALRSYSADFATWDALADRTALELLSEGQAILRRELQIVADHVRFAGEVEIDGHKVLSVNATVLTSEIAGELAAGRPFGVCWFQRADGKRCVSLRSRDGGLDVSEVAKSHGGGGHRNAAGYEE